MASRDFEVIKKIERIVSNQKFDWRQLRLRRSDKLYYDNCYVVAKDRITEIRLSNVNIARTNKVLPLFKKMTELKVLDLSGTGIIDISFLKGLVKLQHLNLSNNNIVNISILKELRQLKRIDLSRNKIHNIDALKDSVFLIKLNCTSNQLTELPFWITEFPPNSIEVYNNPLTSTATANLS